MTEVQLDETLPLNANYFRAEFEPENKGSVEIALSSLNGGGKSSVVRWDLDEDDWVVSSTNDFGVTVKKSGSSYLEFSTSEHFSDESFAQLTGVDKMYVVTFI